MTRRQMFQNKASVRSLNRDNRSSPSLDKASPRPYQTKLSLIESKVEVNLMRQEQTVKVLSQTKMTSFIYKAFLTPSIKCNNGRLLPSNNGTISQRSENHFLN